MLEEHRVRGLIAIADRDDEDAAFAADLEHAGRLAPDLASRVDPEPAHERLGGELDHPGGHLEPFGKHGLRVPVENGRHRGPLAGGPGVGDEGGIVTGAVEHAARPGLDEGPEELDRVAATASTRIVARVGEDERRAPGVFAVLDRRADRIVQRGQGFAEPAPVRPAALRNLAGEALRGVERGASGDDDADAVERRIGECEVAED